VVGVSRVAARALRALAAQCVVCCLWRVVRSRSAVSCATVKHQELESRFSLCFFKMVSVVRTGVRLWLKNGLYAVHRVLFSAFLVLG